VAIKAINDIGLDYYLLKPWDPPEDRLYPVVDDLLDDWREANRDHTSDVRVVGHRWSERSHEVKMFLARNHVPYRWYDVERDPEARRLLDLAQAAAADLPLVLVPEGDTLRSPSALELAGALGLRTTAQQPLYDVCIVGGGPAGLAAAVYAASEGLSTVIVEREAPGGHAGQSAAIENYLGFPKGLSGSDLTRRAIAQARRFGAEMVVARDVVGFEARGPVRAVRFDGSGEIEARALIVATGVAYRRLEAAGLEELTGRGVYYGVNAGEASQCQGDDVYVVGAANSAGQAALNLARFAKRVVLVVRAASLAGTMSSYLVERITAAPNIAVRTAVRWWRAGATATWRRSPWPTGTPGSPRRSRRAGCSFSSAPRPAPSGSAPTSSATRRGSWSPAMIYSAPPGRGAGRWPGRRSPWRRACPACSPPATSGSTR
jgi:thioredoxin reductase (NADPH)